MKYGTSASPAWIAVMFGLCTCLWGQEATDKAVFQNDPEARALYDAMIQAFRRPQSLSYQSEYRFESNGKELDRCTYTVRLQKPNQFRLEGVSADDKRSATIVGDGQTLWLFWSGDRPRFGSDSNNALYNKTKSNAYMTKPAPPGKHSIGHETGYLGVGVNMPVLDPSTFFGYTDSLQRYLDGVAKIEPEKVADELCDGIEVSFMKHQRSWYLWLSPRDHLPRKLKEVVRVARDITMYETWSQIVMDAPLPAEKFAWTPPPGWQPWHHPDPEESLLKPGTTAPDFELPLADGKKVKLSDFRDKIVWFYIWRAG